MKRVHECDTFISRFNFRREMDGMVGVERERFLTTQDSVLVPRAKDFLSAISNFRWTYEISACQVEDRTNPLENIGEIRRALAENDHRGQTIAKQLGLCLRTIEVAEEGMSLIIYPDPRYLKIKSKITREQLSAACRVTGTHLHFGISDMERAIQVSNLLRQHIDFFCKLGDHSSGERLRLYKIVAKQSSPPYYQSAQHFFEVARKEMFLENPRNCWHLIRLSMCGTVELRMFGVTENIDEVCQWIHIVKEIIKKELGS